MNRICSVLAIKLCMLLQISLVAQIPNGGFEDWVADGSNNNPVDWETTNKDPILSVTPYTPAYAGNFSVKVSTYDAGVLVKKLIDSEWVSSKGSFYWDGSNENEVLEEIGIYIVYFEAINTKGEKNIFKKPCVLGKTL